MCPEIAHTFKLSMQSVGDADLSDKEVRLGYIGN